MKKDGVVILLPPDTGGGRLSCAHVATRGVHHPLATDLPREIAIKSIPSGHWAAVSQFIAESDANVLELNAKEEKLEDHGKLTLLFTSPRASTRTSTRSAPT